MILNVCGSALVIPGALAVALDLPKAATPEPHVAVKKSPAAVIPIEHDVVVSGLEEGG